MKWKQKVELHKEKEINTLNARVQSRSNAKWIDACNMIFLAYQ